LGDAQKQQVLCLGTRQDQALIISGEALIIIQSDITFQDKFIDVAEKADVVIACRVSPKQKADIILMIR
jgi:magnesium-transporting ATPase (P-type)